MDRTFLASHPQGMRAPLWAERLGLAGLIPFFGLAALGWFGPAASQAPALLALLAYGATILSFLGGIVWGFAIADTRNEADLGRHAPLFILGVLPQLLGWGALLVGGRAGHLAVAAGLVAMLWLDRRIVAEGRAPGWYGALRLRLSLLAALAMLAGALQGGVAP
ncbi:MAG: DUF3429 domain-containing protein [Beijerinckiaceae bacterium]|nr:DUF3429 domain-containing protein [Beijerinckiaceae bacterium]